MMSYIQTANFVKYTETDVASLIRKAGKNPAKIGAEFLPHVERFPNGKTNLHLVDRDLAEKVGGINYMEELEKNPYYIWRKLQENIQMIKLARDEKITRAKLPISVLVENTDNIPFEDNGDLMNRYFGVYKKDDPFQSSHYDGRIPNVEPIEDKKNVVNSLKF